MLNKNGVEMKDELPLVSIIIPCRNEEDMIGRCLKSIVAQDYPKEKTEVLVIDGMSSDKTIEIIKSYQARYNNIKLIKNPNKITPVAFNIGLNASKGQVIIIMGAHAEYDYDYISKCVEGLIKYGVDNIGGNMITLPAKNTAISKAISLVLSSSFGVGKSYFRIGLKEPKYVDTVFGGCYKRSVFEKIGYFNEKLQRCQDIEFNLRLKKHGMKTLLDPEIKCYYYPPYNLLEFIKKKYVDGIWAILSFKYSNIIPVTLKSLVPLFFIVSIATLSFLSYFDKIFLYFLILELLLYFLFDFVYCSRIIIKEKNILLGLCAFITFPALHISYGLGSLIGLINLITILIKEKCFIKK